MADLGGSAVPNPFKMLRKKFGLAGKNTKREPEGEGYFAKNGRQLKRV